MHGALVGGRGDEGRTSSELATTVSLSKRKAPFGCPLPGSMAVVATKVYAWQLQLYSLQAPSMRSPNSVVEIALFLSATSYLVKWKSLLKSLTYKISEIRNLLRNCLCCRSLTCCRSSRRTCGSENPVVSTQAIKLLKRSGGSTAQGRCVTAPRPAKYS